MIRIAVFILLSGLSMRFASATDWPDYIGRLTPSVSESAVSAELPADVNLVTPGADVPGARARFAGLWRGWACRNRFCDIAIAVEQVEADRAVVVYARAYAGAGNTADRVVGEFSNGELEVKLPNKTRLVMRLRADDDMELTVWGPDGRLRAAGVTTRKPFSYTRTIERLATPWSTAGEPVTLVLVRYRPRSRGPYPTVLMHHGSTGRGDDPGSFGWTWSSPEVAGYFVERGWQVLFPQRRGRGGSGGTYAEGLSTDGSGYSCDPEVSLSGADHALADIDVVLEALAADASIKSGRMLTAGVSRGGIVALGSAARHPHVFRGVINFVGGWMGEGCANVARINPVLFRRAAKFPGPTLWLYGDNDSFYSLRHSRANYDAFAAQGGEGRFEALQPSGGGNGHFIFASPQLWAAHVDRYLRLLKAP